jgi:hypothetical protein
MYLYPAQFTSHENHNDDEDEHDEETLKPGIIIKCSQIHLE